MSAGIQACTHALKHVAVKGKRGLSFEGKGDGVAPTHAVLGSFLTSELGEERLGIHLCMWLFFSPGMDFPVCVF